MTNDVPILTLADLLEILQRRLVWIVLTLAACLALALAFGLTRTPKFEATATVALDQGDGPIDFARERDPRSPLFSVINTEREALLATSVLSTALDRGGLMENAVYQSAVDPISVLRQRLRITTNRDSLAITLHLMDEDPQRAQDALSTLINAYLDQQRARSRRRGDENIGFLHQQVAEAQAREDAARKAESSFRQEHGLLGSDPERNLISQRLTELYQQEGSLGRQLDASQNVVDAIVRLDADVDPFTRRQGLLGIEVIAAQSLVIEQQRALGEIQARLAGLAQKYLDRHPRMIEVREQVLVRESQLDDAIAAARQSLLLNHSTLVAQRDGLAARIAQEERRLTAFRDHLITLAALSEQTQFHGKMRQQLTERLEQQRIAARLDRRYSEILDPALASFTPKGPGLALILALGLGVGGALALTVPVVIDLLDRRITGVADARSTAGVSVLAEIPTSSGPFHLHPGSLGDDASAEAIRLLRSAITMHFAGDPSPRCLAIAPTDRHCELGVVTARLAASLALAGGRVLLVEGDLRAMPLSSLLNSPVSDGFADLLAGQPDIAPVASPIANLDYLGPGNVPSGIGELLHSHCLPEWLAEARGQYDFIVFNIPVIDRYADVLAMMPYLDLLVVMARTRSTTRRVLTRAIGLLNPFADRLLGIVLQGHPQAQARHVLRAESANG